MAPNPRGSSSGENTTTSVPGGSAVRGIRPTSGVTKLSYRAASIISAMR